ncbi:MAG: MBL fold metallo-hydrolase [Dehalococcoidales bacterium]|nr:MBL fold metallo-hydrolase [Dehalococcoidales bacterium]
MSLKLTFLGAAGNVTGSRYLLEINHTRLLVDCGLHQERELRDRDWAPFPVPPSTIDAVLLTHAHVDHCGLLPKFVRDGFRGRIYCTSATAELAEIILLDAAHLQQEDAEYKKTRHQREGRKGPHPYDPLYTADDARASFPLFSPVEYGQTISLGEGIRATFYDAGHVLGSTMVKLAIGHGKDTRTIVFSGDIGRWDRPILQDPTTFDNIDYILMESTYGDRLHEGPADISDKLEEIINATRRAGGNIIVPSFALERAQEILYYMNKLLLANRIPHMMVFLDSPMAINITEVFKRHSKLFDNEMVGLIKAKKSPFDFPGLKLVQTVEESKAINHIIGTIMIIAGSGMCTGGRIKHHLVTNISRHESTILFAGYQAVGTLGRQIVDGAAEVRILGRRYPVQAKIVQMHGLSAHADKNDLYRWLSALSKAPKHLFVTHGEAEVARRVGEYAKEKTGWEVSVPEYGTTVSLD